MTKARLARLLVGSILWLGLTAGCSGGPSESAAEPMATATNTPTSIPSSTTTPLPSPTPSPSPTATRTTTPTRTPTMTPSPTPEGRIAFYTDPIGDGSQLESGTTCLPAFLDLASVTVMAPVEGGLDIVLVTADTIPTENVDPRATGFELYVQLEGETAARAIILMQEDGSYSPRNNPGEGPPQNQGVNVEFSGAGVTLRLAAELVEDWPELAKLQVRAHFWPDPKVNLICSDFVPDSMGDWIPFELH